MYFLHLFPFRSIFQSISLSTLPCSTACYFVGSTKQSAYFTVRVTFPHIFKPSEPWRTSLVQKNNISLKQRPSLTPLPVFTTLVSLWSSFILTLRSIYNLLISLFSRQLITSTLSWPCLWLQFSFRSTVFLLCFFVVCILPFPSFFYFIDHFLCNPGFFALLSTILIK